jgi:SPP1 family predicted phage head-tail adaptor
MDARARNKKVTIKSRTPGTDGDGQPFNTWTVTVASVMANIRYQRGLEAIKGGAEVATGMASINIGWRTGLTEDMRVEHGSTVFQIKAILPDETRKSGVDLAVEVVA